MRHSHLHTFVERNWMKSRRGGRAWMLCLSLLIALVMPSTAIAQEAEGVTLSASRKKVRFGASIKLSGAVEPAAAAETVIISDDEGTVVAEAATDESGAYEVNVTPRENMTLTATWSTSTSNAVTVKVRAIVKAKLRDVALFGRARVRGKVRPGLTGKSVRIKLLRYGRPVADKRVRVKNGHWFSGRLRVRRPGVYRAKAVVESPDHLRDVDRSGRKSTTLPSLGPGSRGEYVKALERRLIQLGYYLPDSDGYFDHRTSDALIAFHKVQRRARVGTVTAATWRKLARPIKARPRHRGPKFHIEIDQTRQVIFTVKKGKVRHILHTSTGAGGATRDGSWRVFRKIAGYSGGGLYFPSYFDGLRAIHGWPEVPVYPASHGCARVPMWAATWIHGKAAMGTRVYVYH
jgi:N-acetylmuramoyl-L-alanine amidase